MPHTLTGLLLLVGLGALAQEYYGDRTGTKRTRARYLTGGTVQTHQSGQGKTSRGTHSSWAPIGFLGSRFDGLTDKDSLVVCENV